MLLPVFTRYKNFFERTLRVRWKVMTDFRRRKKGRPKKWLSIENKHNRKLVIDFGLGTSGSFA